MLASNLALNLPVMSQCPDERSFIVGLYIVR